MPRALYRAGGERGPLRCLVDGWMSPALCLTGRECRPLRCLVDCSAPWTTRLVLSMALVVPCCVLVERPAEAPWVSSSSRRRSPREHVRSARRGQLSAGESWLLCSCFLLNLLR